MKISCPSCKNSDRVQFEISVDSKESSLVYVCSDDVLLSVSPEACVAAALLPAMHAGEDLSLPGSLDPMFADCLSTIQDIYATWYDEAERVDVQAPVEGSSSSAADGCIATFFSGGVDSFYTLLKHDDDIDTLVYVHGFDVDLDDMPLRRQVSNMLHQVAHQFDKEVIELETNLRDFSDPRAGWEKYHGAALATIALTLQNRFSRIFVPSSLPYDNLKPWGSNPLLDPLWSTRRLEFIHDGCEADRLSKCQRVAESRQALQHLRVCWENRDGSYNCGRCEKCVRTMIQLLAAGGLERCTTFEEPLDPSRISDFSAVWQKSYRYRPSLEELKATDRAPDVVRAIEKGLKGPSWLDRAAQRTYNTARAIRYRITNLF